MEDRCCQRRSKKRQNIKRETNEEVSTILHWKWNIFLLSIIIEGYDCCDGYLSYLSWTTLDWTWLDRHWIGWHSRQVSVMDSIGVDLIDWIRYSQSVSILFLFQNYDSQTKMRELISFHSVLSSALFLFFFYSIHRFSLWITLLSQTLILINRSQIFQI